MTWSVENTDSLNVTIHIGDLVYIARKADVSIAPYDTGIVLVTIEIFKYAKFQVSPIGKFPICYAMNFENCITPTDTTRDGLIDKINNLLLPEGVKIAKNGVYVGYEPEINFIEGTDITINAVNDPSNGKIDVTINATGGGGGGVTTFSAGTTGFTPNSPTSGAVTLAGTLAVANGGTGLTTTPTNGQLLIGNGTNYTLNTLTAGTGISITNGAGSVTINNTGVTDDPFPKILMLMGG